MSVHLALHYSPKWGQNISLVLELSQMWAALPRNLVLNILPAHITLWSAYFARTERDIQSFPVHSAECEEPPCQCGNRICAALQPCSLACGGKRRKGRETPFDRILLKGRHYPKHLMHLTLSFQLTLELKGPRMLKPHLSSKSPSS